MTFADAITRFETDFLPIQKPSTARAWISGIRKWILPSLGEVPMDASFPGRLSSTIPIWSCAGLSPKTVRNLVGIVERIWGFCGLPTWADGVIALPKATEAATEARCFTTEEVRAIIAEAEGQYRTLFITAAGTGMRVGELFGLKIEDVDIVRNTVVVRRSVFGSREQSPKSQAGYRRIKIDSFVVSILQQHIGTRTNGYIFATSAGTPLCQANVLRRVLHPILNKLGIKRAGFHAFRHYRVSFLVMNHVPMEAIRRWIGHTADSMVARYMHLTDDYDQEAMNRLPALLTKPSL